MTSNSRVTIDSMINLDRTPAEVKHSIVGGVKTLEGVETMTLSLIYSPLSRFFCS